MQPPATGPRANRVANDIIKLIKRSSNIEIDAGLELINRNLDVTSDISQYLGDSEVSRDNFATLHGSFAFNLTTQLTWGSAIVRPYATLHSNYGSARFNLGAYFTNTPDSVTGESPTTYSVQGYDILDGLNAPVGDSYTVQVGVEYLTAIENILLSQGYTKYTINTSRAGTTLPSARAWLMDDNATWLTIVNDLLGAIGYRGIYSDWDGQLVCVPYVEPSNQQVEWTYDDGKYTSELGPQQTVKHDYYATPNKWIGVRSNNAEGTTPVEGNGIFIFQNDYDGETSVEARGRVIPTSFAVEVADQAALMTAVMRKVASDKSVSTMIEADTTPNPLHWHFDVLSVETAELGVLKVRENSWKLPLTGGQMTHSWVVL